MVVRSARKESIVVNFLETGSGSIYFQCGSGSGSRKSNQSVSDPETVVVIKDEKTIGPLNIVYYLCDENFIFLGTIQSS